MGLVYSWGASEVESPLEGFSLGRVGLVYSWGASEVASPLEGAPVLLPV